MTSVLKSGLQPEQRVQSYYQRVDADDVPGLLALFAADAVYERPGYPPLRGRGALRRFYEQERVIASGAHVVTSCLVEGRRVAVEGRFRGELRDGSTVDLRFSDFFSLDDSGTFSTRCTYFYAPAV